MPQGIQVFDAGGNVLMDSDKIAALFHSTLYASAGFQGTLSFPGGLNNCGAIAWPDNGHLISSWLSHDTNGNPYWQSVLGSYKQVPQHVSGGLQMSYPAYRVEYWTGSVWDHDGTWVSAPGSAAVDLWVN